MLLFKPFPRALFVHFVNSSAALLWFVRAALLRVGGAAGLGRAVVLRPGAVAGAVRGTACGVATTVAGALALPLDPTVVHGLVGPVGEGVVILLARSA